MLFRLMEVLRSEIAKSPQSPLVDEVVKIRLAEIEKIESEDIEKGVTRYITGTGTAAQPHGTITFIKDAQ